MATEYAGIKVTANSADFDAIKIADGVHDIFATTSGQVMSNPEGGAEIVLTNVTVDAENNVLSGYDSSGTRYIIDKEANITVAIA